MEIVITIKIEDGEPVKVDVKQANTESVEEYSEYARFFDETSASWSKDPESNRIFLALQERYADEKLKAVGHLFLNEVYDMLGMPRTKAGQVVGWIIDNTVPIEGKIVDFGLTKKHNSKFVNGYEKSALLDFNVHGNILDIIK